jgi:hypothetical protein
VSDLLPPPAPPGAGPPQTTRTTDPWRKYLVPGLVGGVLVLIVIGAIAGLVEHIESSDADTSAACTTVDMEPLTGWSDPVTVVQLDTTDSQGKMLYAWGIDDAVWVASRDNPNGSAVILPVNRSARAYDPELGAGVDVFGTAYADAASEAEAALAECA